MSRANTGAANRLSRLLAIVPWIAANDGPELADVCSRFGCTEEQLLNDLELLFLCGLHPYTPDVLIDVDIADGRVWIRYADFFSRPLRLTPAEGLALLAAARAVMAIPGNDAGGPLARGVAKLSKALGVGEANAGAVEISLGPASEDTLRRLEQAVSDRRQVDLEYYAFGRDAWTRRVVDPAALFSAGGQWYLSAWCHHVDDERLFRVDRIRDATVLDTNFEPRSDGGDLAVYRPRSDDPRVTLELEPAARWVIEQYPMEKVVPLDGGRLRVTLAASERAWLERLLLRLGPLAHVIGADSGVGPAAASRLLARYAHAGDGLGPTGTAKDLL